jgi:hypothetical protein
MLTNSITFLVTSPPLNIKGGVEAPPREEQNHNIYYPEQYKNMYKNYPI